MLPPKCALLGALLCLVNLDGAAAQQYTREDLYATMNLTREATTKEIKKMYQKWSRMLHPDITVWPKELAKQRLIKVTEAYEILADEDRKKDYDSSGRVDLGTDPNTEWKRSKLFDGTHDAFQFRDADTLKAAIDNKENWFILFWGKNYPECLDASAVWQKFATRMKGIVNVGTVQCDELMPSCRSFGMNTLPAIFSLKKGVKGHYRGRIEQQSLVEYAADNLLSHSNDHIIDYKPGYFGQTAPIIPALETAAPGSSLASGLQGMARPTKYTLSVPEAWELVTFEYTDCMDCRIELTLATETLQMYTRGDNIRVVRVDCEKKRNQDFCKIAPSNGKAWRVAHVTRSSFYAPGANGGAWTHIKTTPLKLSFLPTGKAQWSARDLTNFVFQHQDSAIIKLTPKSFYKTVLQERTAWAILFTTSKEGCENCGKYQADWEIMARITQGYISPKGTKLRVASIDCGEHEAFCSSLGFGGKLPALRMYRGGIEAKEQEPHKLNLMDPPSMLRECKREMEPLKLYDLDMESFDRLVNNKTGEATKPNNWFILYNAGSWCPPCNQIRQPWKDATRIVDEGPVGSKIKIGQVDCETQEALCRKHKIESYPTMQLHLQQDNTASNPGGCGLLENQIPTLPLTVTSTF
ncbi:Chaperone protein DnaJ [Diplonema papillatum]|nr:Chaperone protein DnaJ [Diplonema papillatum]